MEPWNLQVVQGSGARDGFDQQLPACLDPALLVQLLGSLQSQLFVHMK